MNVTAVARLLERGREAAALGAFDEAWALFAQADAEGNLSTDDLLAMAGVAYASGRVDLTVATWERIHAARLESDDVVGAADAAARVAMHLLFDTALMAPVRGWLSRAEQLLHGQEDGAAHAWVAVVRAYERLLGGDPEGARPWARRAVAVGSTTDPAACAIGRVVEARLVILDGDVQEGVALLNQVGVAATSGALDPLSTGVVFCELVCALQGLAQYDLAEEWTQAMERWSSRNAVGSLHGRCRVHRAEILRLRGAYDEAETEVLAACDELRPYLRRELGWPLCELGRIRLHKGDVDGAEQALLAAHHAGWDPEPGLSLVRLARGDGATASLSIRDALERPAIVPSKELPPSTALRRAPLLEAQVQIAIFCRDLEVAAEAAAELEAIARRFGSRALLASAAHARGRLELALDNASAAELVLADAVASWTDVGAPYEAARARIDLASAHRRMGRTHKADLELTAARAVLERLGGRVPSDTAPAAEGARRDSYRSAERTKESAAVLRLEGDAWWVTFEGSATRVKDIMGLRYLARLLAVPGREFHALDLVVAEHPAPADEPSPDARRASDASGATMQPLDEQAKAAYRRRLAEIDEDLEEAHRNADSGRLSQARAEREFLVRELSRAFGLGGGARRTGSQSERARVSVTRALRKAMARIGKHHAALGAHLDHAIQTGTFCAYLPDPRAPVDWTIDWGP